MVVLRGVDGELAEQFSGGDVDDADAEVVDEEEHVGSGVGSPDADVVEVSVDAQRDDAGGVDGVAPDAVVVVVATGGGGFGSGEVRLFGGDVAGVGAVAALGVVDGSEGIEEGLEFGGGGGVGSCA